MLLKAVVPGVIALCVFTGCGGATGGPAPAPTPTPTPTPIPCNAMVVAISGTLISPAAGATGVSTAVGSVSFAVDARFLAGSFVLYPTAGGANVYGSAISGTADHATASIPILQSGTSYSALVTAAINPPSACIYTATLGTFTTGS